MVEKSDDMPKLIAAYVPAKVHDLVTRARKKAGLNLKDAVSFVMQEWANKVLKG